MNKDERRERIIRRNEDVHRLRQLTVAAGVLGVGLFGAASIVAASNQPGHAIGLPDGSGTASQSSSLSSQPTSQFQPPAIVPMARGGSGGMAMSGGS